MLILADGEDVRDLIPADDSRIRVVHLSERLDIGAKRNFGCEIAAGEVIAHWDDDDYSAPERLANQILRLRSTGKSVTGFHSMRFTDGSQWRRYKGISTYALGTSLCYLREWWRSNRFQSLQIGEDFHFAQCAAQAGQLASVDAGLLMYATIHPENTSPRSLGDGWELIDEAEPRSL